MTDHLAVLERMLADHLSVLHDHVPDFEKRELTEETAALRAAIALTRGQSWQDIATAPKDRVHILAWFPTCKCSFTVVWMYDAWCFAGAGLVPYGAPTLWMPVPTPPKDTADEQ